MMLRRQLAFDLMGRLIDFCAVVPLPFKYETILFISIAVEKMFPLRQTLAFHRVFGT